MAVDPWIPVEPIPQTQLHYWEVPKWLKDCTCRIEYSPNCPIPFLVRLVGKGNGQIRGDTRDAIGYGQTIVEAALRAHLSKGV